MNKDKITKDAISYINTVDANRYESLLHFNLKVVYEPEHKPDSYRFHHAVASVYNLAFRLKARVPTYVAEIIEQVESQDRPKPDKLPNIPQVSEDNLNVDLII